ncbi:hypothetical protein [Gracilibacillus boraciitolerans]|nr:hypothetical protein [Gracilibacillus boraciitolerans]
MKFIDEIHAYQGKFNYEELHGSLLIGGGVKARHTKKVLMIRQK